jgi:uncharacterized protein (DUF302 family)
MFKRNTSMRRQILAVLGVALSALVLSVPAGAAKTAAPKTQQSAGAGVYKIAIDRNVSMADAAESMRLRANALNLKLVAELPLSKQVESITNQPQRTITIFQFCDAVTAKDLIDVNLDFAVYMPCRIALIEDAKGQGWLVMMDVNVDAIAKEKRLPQVLKDRVNAVRKSLIEIMQAGAKGEL